MTLVVADIAPAVGSLVTSIIAKATVIMVLTLVGVRLARKSRAAVRHVLLASAFAVLLSLPMTSILFPSVRVVQVPITVRRTTQSPELPSRTGLTSATHPVSAVSTGRAVIVSSRVPGSVLLLAGWATGALLSLLPVLVGLCQVGTLSRLGCPWQHGQTVVRRLAAEVDIHRHVEVLLHQAVSSPASYGVLRPAIVLPMDAQTWQEDDLNRAIIHELEHLRRSDWVSQCLARAVCAFYWFHPLVWIARRQLALEAERACDDAVLRRAEATDYADQLVVLAERMSTTPNRVLLTMTNRTDLVLRVAAVLDSRQQRGRAGVFSIALACVGAALLVATISPLRIAAQIQAPTQTFSGSLIDPFGRTLPSTRLTLWNTSTQQPIEARTDQAGHFSLEGIPAGDYQLQVHEFGSQGRITFAPGQHLYRDIAVMLDGIEDTITVYSSEAPTVLPPLPPPLPPPSRTSQPDPGQADLARRAQVSMFCRVMPPVQIARPQPIYPTRQRESGVAGTVVAEGRVGTDGLIKDLRPLAPANPDFARATFDALRRWQFTPIRFDSVPVEMKIRVTANFVAQ